MQAWLIEVNHAPSFRGGSKVDNRVKKGAVRQALKLLRVSERRKRLLVARVRKQWELFMRQQATRPRTAPAGTPSAPGAGPARVRGASAGGTAPARTPHSAFGRSTVPPAAPQRDRRSRSSGSTTGGAARQRPDGPQPDAAAGADDEDWAAEEMCAAPTGGGGAEGFADGDEVFESSSSDSGEEDGGEVEPGGGARAPEGLAAAAAPAAPGPGRRPFKAPLPSDPDRYIKVFVEGSDTATRWYGHLEAMAAAAFPADRTGAPPLSRTPAASASGAVLGAPSGAKLP